MLHGGSARRMGRVGTCRAFVSPIFVRTATAAAVTRPGRPGGLRREDQRRRRCKKSLRRLVLHP